MQMAAMEAIAAARTHAKADAEPNKRRLTPKAKAASYDCADLAAYNR